MLSLYSTSPRRCKEPKQLIEQELTMLRKRLDNPDNQKTTTIDMDAIVSQTSLNDTNIHELCVNLEVPKALEIEKENVEKNNNGTYHVTKRIDSMQMSC